MKQSRFVAAAALLASSIGLAATCFAHFGAIIPSNGICQHRGRLGLGPVHLNTMATG